MGAIGGDLAIVGATGDDDNGENSGAAYVYRFGGVDWVEEQKLLASDGAPGDGFGTVALAGGMALIGARHHTAVDQGNVERGGAVYVFSFDGVEWVETQKLVPSDLAELQTFGSHVVVSGNRALIGGRGSGFGWPFPQPSVPAASYVYRLDGTVWIEEAKLEGEGIAFTGNAAITQEPDWQPRQCSSEHVRLYHLDSGSWILNRAFTRGNQVVGLGLGENLIVVATAPTTSSGRWSSTGARGSGTRPWLPATGRQNRRIWAASPSEKT